jgi:hypothetical protein|tara:strand:+ start:3785 stop:4279 length:495 start_codon:yes stop_codon:yes gene_type:complete
MKSITAHITVISPKLMNQKTIHNLTWIPLFLIGLGSVGLGLGWLIHPEPWILDQAPNEALLQTSFQILFAADINVRLPDYLLVIYRFFGWWVMSIGLLIMTYVHVTRMGTTLARNSILGVLLTILVGVAYMVFNFIPSSPFKVVIYLQSAMWLTSAYYSTQLRD